jgi:hypothetical protein
MDAPISPDDWGANIAAPDTIDRERLEAQVADAHRRNQMCRHHVGQVLGLDRWQTEEFLAARGAIRPYDLADLEVDRATWMVLRGTAVAPRAGLDSDLRG